MTISVDLNYYFPCTVPPKSDLFRTKEKKQELVHAASYLLGKDYVLTEATMNFINGSVVLQVQPTGNPEYSASCVIDAVATKFFQEQKEYIESINPALAAKLENLPAREDIEKITDIFYFTFNNYLKENPNDESVADSTVTQIRPGLKSPKYHCGKVMDMEELGLDSGLKFKGFLKSLPISLLDKKEFKKGTPFLEKALEQKSSLNDKLLYLRQVIGFLLLQDIFKNSLEELKLSIAIEKQCMYSSPNREVDLTVENSRCAYRSNRIEETLAKFPLNSILTLIPLACRSHPSKLSDFDLLNKDPETQHPFIIDSQYLAQECNNAREADIALRAVLEDSFKAPPQKFFEKNDYFGKRNLESFLMGVSSLAISPGLYGRLPMCDHHTIYYKRDGIINIDGVFDNIPCEFLMTAAQFLFEKEYNWIESNCFAYLQEMMGNPSIYELDAIKAKFQRIRDVVQRLPVESLLKPGSTCNSHILRNSGIKKLHALYEQGRQMSGLQRLSSNIASSSCSIS